MGLRIKNFKMEKNPAFRGGPKKPIGRKKGETWTVSRFKGAGLEKKKGMFLRVG